jgi:hypothetical protein
MTNDTTIGGARLGGLVLASSDPQRLSAWYRIAFAPAAPPGTVLELPTGRLIFDSRDDIAPSPVEPGRILVNMYVDDIGEVAGHLTAIGVTWVRPVEPFPPGLIGTVLDEDGNYVQVIQLNDDVGRGR